MSEERRKKIKIGIIGRMLKLFVIAHLNKYRAEEKRKRKGRGGERKKNKRERSSE